MGTHVLTQLEGICKKKMLTEADFQVFFSAFYTASDWSFVTLLQGFIAFMSN